MMKLVQYKLIIALLAILTLAGCRGKKGEPGPAGIADNTLGLSTNGSFIKGTVSTTTTSGTAVTFTFNNTAMSSDNYFGGNAAGTGIELYKDFQGWSSGYDKAKVTLTLDSMSDLMPSAPLLSMDATTKFSGDSVFHFSLGSQTMVLSNYLYNASDRTMSGDFSLSSSTTGNSHAATISGSFRFTDVRAVVQRRGVQ
jgi:hypothetical protein